MGRRAKDRSDRGDNDSRVKPVAWVDASKRTGARDVWSLSSGCRETPTETLTFTAVRSGGNNGPVTLRVSYPG